MDLDGFEKSIVVLVLTFSASALAAVFRWFILPVKDRNDETHRQLLQHIEDAHKSHVEWQKKQIEMNGKAISALKSQSEALQRLEQKKE